MDKIKNKSKRLEEDKKVGKRKKTVAGLELVSNGYRNTLPLNCHNEVKKSAVLSSFVLAFYSRRVARCCATYLCSVDNPIT